MTAKQFNAKRKAMPNSELIELCDDLISKLCKTGGRAFTMRVPPMITDSDMLLTELVRRFKESLSTPPRAEQEGKEVMSAEEFLSKNYTFVDDECYQCNHSGQYVGMADFAESYATHRLAAMQKEVVDIVFKKLNEWAYNETNEAGTKLIVIDASDLPEIKTEIMGEITRRSQPTP